MRRGWLALVVEMLVLMDLTIHMGVCVCVRVHVCVNLGVDLRGPTEAGGSQAHQSLAGVVRASQGTTGGGGAGLFVRDVVVSVDYRYVPGSQGVVEPTAVAQPEYDSAYDEEGCCRDADDQRPGQAGAQVWRSQCVLHLRVWTHNSGEISDSSTDLSFLKCYKTRYNKNNPLPFHPSKVPFNS